MHFFIQLAKIKTIAFGRIDLVFWQLSSGMTQSGSEGGPNNRIGWLQITPNIHLRLMVDSILIGVVILCGLACTLFLLRKYRFTEASKLYYGFLVFGITLTLFEVMLVWNPFIRYTPYLFLHEVVFFIWAPSYYLYLFHSINKRAPKRVWTHFLLFFLGLVGVLLTGYEPFGLIEPIFRFMANNPLIKLTHMLIYVLAGAILISNGRVGVTEKNLKSILWTERFMKILTLLLLANTLALDEPEVHEILWLITMTVLFVFVLVVTIATFSVQDKFQFFRTPKKEPDKYKYSPLTNDMSIGIKNDLLHLLQEDRVYLDNEISLDKISKRLDVDRYVVSQVINQGFGKNFYELINDYRIDYAVAVLLENMKIHKYKKKIKVIDLVYDCGFNNKVSFYKAFKQRKGMTPSQYRNSISSNEEVVFR